MKKIIIVGLFLLVLFGCKQTTVQIAGEVEKQWRSDSVEVTLPNARRRERLMVASIQKDGTFHLSGNIAPGKLVFVNFSKDYVRIPVYIEQKHYTLVESGDKYYLLSEESSLQNRYVEFLKELDKLRITRRSVRVTIPSRTFIRKPPVRKCWIKSSRERMSLC